MSESTPARLKVAWLTVNRSCNFRCRWCYASGTHYGAEDEMSIETAERIVDILNSLGVKQLTIIGGEPTLWPHLGKLNRYSQERGIETGLVTNGARFGSDSYWESYLQDPCDKVGISVKGGTSQQLLEVAGVRSYEAVKKGISRAVKYYNAGVSTVYSTLVEDSLIEIAQFAHECGAKDLKLEFCTTVFSEGKPNGEFMVEPKKVVQNMLRDYPTIEKVMGGQVIFEMNMPFCLWPEKFIQDLIDKEHITSVCNVYKRTGIIFDVDGKIMVCNGLFDYPIGQLGVDFTNSDSLAKHINQPKISDYYDQLARMPSPLCAECKWYNSCGGGCPLNWAVYSPADLIKPLDS